MPRNPLARLRSREIVTGIGLLASSDPRPWIWGRVAGDALDLSTLALGAGERPGTTPQRDAALWMTTAVGVVDIACALLPDRDKKAGATIDYSDRVGMPRAPEQMRGAARDFEVPRDMRPPEALRAYATPGNRAGSSSSRNVPAGFPSRCGLRSRGREIALFRDKADR